CFARALALLCDSLGKNVVVRALQSFADAPQGRNKTTELPRFELLQGARSNVRHFRELFLRQFALTSDFPDAAAQTGEPLGGFGVGKRSWSRHAIIWRIFALTNTPYYGVF